jgi:hypothetical protein
LKTSETWFQVGFAMNQPLSFNPFVSCLNNFINPDDGTTTLTSLHMYIQGPHAFRKGNKEKKAPPTNANFTAANMPFRYLFSSNHDSFLN